MSDPRAEVEALPGWEDFEPNGPRETLAYALMVAGVAMVKVEGDDRVGLDQEAADRVLEALDWVHPVDCRPECFDGDCTRHGCIHHRAILARPAPPSEGPTIEPELIESALNELERRVAEKSLPAYHPQSAAAFMAGYLTGERSARLAPPSEGCWACKDKLVDEPYLSCRACGRHLPIRPAPPSEDDECGYVYTHASGYQERCTRLNREHPFPGHGGWVRDLRSAPPSEGLEGFVKRLYDLGVVDKTVTAENVMSVLQRAADKGKLTIETVVRAALTPTDPSAE